MTTMTPDFIAEAVAACQEQDATRLQAAIRESVAHTSVEETQRLFREEVPLHLGPKNLTWLLRQITDEEGFNQSRDHILDALVSDLGKNGHVLGKDFSFIPDQYVGRRICLTRKLWAEVREQISERSAQHYRCFLRFAWSPRPTRSRFPIRATPSTRIPNDLHPNTDPAA